MPQHGDKVQIKPAIEHRVLYAPGRFLESEGMEVIWTPFLDERLRTGEIEIVAPEPAEAPAAEAPAAEAPVLLADEPPGGKSTRSKAKE